MGLLMTAALLVVLQVAAPIPGKAIESQATHSKRSTAASASKKEPAGVPPVENRKTADDTKSATQTKASKDERNDAPVRVAPVDIHKAPSDYIYIGASILIAVATFILAIIAGFQAAAAKGSAKAAVLNAQAIIDSERAWVQARPDMPDFKIEKLADPGAIPVFNWSITNAGRTPARLLEVGARYRLIKALSRIPSVREYDGDLERIPLEGVLLFPNERHQSFQPLEPTSLTPDQVTAIRNGEQTLFAYGYVNYLDIFGNRHETGFCYYYLVPQGGLITFAKEGWRPYLQAPPIYSKST